MRIAVVVIALAFMLTACSTWRVAGVSGSGNTLAVSCYLDGGSGRKVVILPVSRARSVHVGDVCPT